MSRKQIIIETETDAPNERLRKAFLDCGLLDIISVKVEDIENE